MLIRKVSRCICLLYVVLLCTPSFAQRKSLPGYYISEQGDTVSGVFTNYPDLNRNPSVVEFNATASAQPIMLKPGNCQKFVVDGYDEYFPYAGQRLLNPIDDIKVLSKNYTSSGDSVEEIVTFLRLVTRTANCELYVFTDNKRTNFFYRLPGSPVMELKYKKYFHENQVAEMAEHNENQIKEIAEYKTQLNTLFSEAIYQGKFTRSLERLPYAEERLKTFLEELFPAETVKHKQKDPAAGLIVSVGVSFNSVKVKADKSFNLVATEYKSSVSPLLSIGYTLPFSRKFGKYFLYPQLSCFNYKNTGEINDGTFKKVTTYQSDLVISGEVNAGFNIINQKSFRFYITGGAGTLVLLKNRRLDSKYLNIQPSAEPYSSSQTSISSKTPPFVNASAGAVIKNKIVVAMAYLFPTAFDDVIGYTPQYSGFQLKIGYKL